MSQAGISSLRIVPPGMVVETLTGNSGGPVGPDLMSNINVIGSGTVDVVGNPGTNTLTISVGGAVADEFDTDAGTAIPVAGVLNIFGDHGINTAGSGNTVTVAINNSIALGDLAPILAGNDALTITSGDITLVGGGLGGAGNINFHNTESDGAVGVINYSLLRFMHNFGDRSAYLGSEAGNLAASSGDDSNGHGFRALNSIDSGDRNNAFGNQGLFSLTTGNDNNTFGYLAGLNLVSGSSNILVGQSAGVSYTGAESSNIIINNAGVLAENNTIRIGTAGSGTGQQNRAFIVGIDGVNVGSVTKVVTMASNQLGTANLVAGAGVTITPGANTITINANGQLYMNISLIVTSPYVVTSTDTFMEVSTASIPITIQLPNTTTTGRVFVIKDLSGNASVNNITVTTVGGVVTIDGSTSYVMNTNRQSIQLVFDATEYLIF